MMKSYLLISAFLERCCASALLHLFSRMSTQIYPMANSSEKELSKAQASVVLLVIERQGVLV